MYAQPRTFAPRHERTRLASKSVARQPIPKVRSFGAASAIYCPTSGSKRARRSWLLDTRALTTAIVTAQTYLSQIRCWKPPTSRPFRLASAGVSDSAMETRPSGSFIRIALQIIRGTSPQWTAKLRGALTLSSHGWRRANSHAGISKVKG